MSKPKEGEPDTPARKGSRYMALASTAEPGAWDDISGVMDSLADVRREMHTEAQCRPTDTQYLIVTIREEYGPETTTRLVRKGD